jgi:hypothetical protein
MITDHDPSVNNNTTNANNTVNSGSSNDSGKNAANMTYDERMKETRMNTRRQRIEQSRLAKHKPSSADGTCFGCY